MNKFIKHLDNIKVRICWIFSTQQRYLYFKCHIKYNHSQCLYCCLDVEMHSMLHSCFHLFSTTCPIPSFAHPSSLNCFLIGILLSAMPTCSIFYFLDDCNSHFNVPSYSIYVVFAVLVVFDKFFRWNCAGCLHLNFLTDSFNLI